MREIKFRVFADGVMRYSYQNETKFKNAVFFKVNMSNESVEIFKVANMYLMQFTGLRDKKGKEVYEDDIIGFWTKDVNKKDKLLRHRVSFNNGAFVLDISRCMDGKLFTDLNRYLQDDYVVIGNIYDNPELLPSSEV